MSQEALRQLHAALTAADPRASSLLIPSAAQSRAASPLDKCPLECQAIFSSLEALDEQMQIGQFHLVVVENANEVSPLHTHSLTLSLPVSLLLSPRS